MLKKPVLTLLLALTAWGCSSTPPPAPEPPPIVAKAPARPVDNSPQLKTITIDPQASEEVTVKSEAIDPALVPTAPEPPKEEKPPVTEAKEATEETAPPPPAQAGVPGPTALGWLKNGNIRYVKNRLRADGVSSADRKRLAKEQRPHTAVLSCSDSRVPPEIVFDQKLGEIFVVRTAGESLDAPGLASLEYAVSTLGVNLILVMGHTQCGAVRLAMETPKTQSAGSPALDTLLGDIRPRLEKVWDGQAPGSPQLLTEVKANAAGITQDLLSRSEILRRKAEQGSLKLESAVYHLESGEVEFQP